MEMKLLSNVNEDTGEKISFYPITHIKAVMVTPETTLDEYLEKFFISLGSISEIHDHKNKSILDNTSASYTEEDRALLLKAVKNSSKVKKNYILEASNWYETTSGIYTYTLEVDNLTIYNSVSLLLNDSISKEEYKVLKDADIQITTSSVGEGVLILKAYGIKPKIDIPISFFIHGMENKDNKDGS